MMKRLRKSINRGSGGGNTVLNEPQLEEEELPVVEFEDGMKSHQQSLYVRLEKSLQKITVWYMRSGTARLIVIFAAILTCCTYVIDTYATDDMNRYKVFSKIVDIVAFVIFFGDYFFNILFAGSKIGYILSFQGLVDFASLFSIINVFVSEDLSFLALFRLMRVLKVMRVFRMTSLMLSVDDQVLPSATEAIYYDILSLFLGILLAWFLFASLLYTMIQQDGDAIVYSLDSDFDIQEDIRFFDCLYIMLVITSTLGFGDFAPNNVRGRLFVIIVLLSAITIVPVQVGKLVDNIGKNPRYVLDAYKPIRGNKPHIVFAANLNSQDFQKLINLILSEGTNDPEIIDHAAPIALLSSVFPSPQLQLLLNHPINSRKVQFFLGSVKNQADLKRVKADSALAILIFTDQSDRDFVDTVDNVIQDDYSLKLKIVSTINFLQQEQKKRIIATGASSKKPGGNYTPPTVICQAVSHEVCFSLLNRGVDRIISNNNVKYTMMAYGAMFPGKCIC